MFTRLKKINRSLPFKLIHVFELESMANYTFKLNAVQIDASIHSFQCS